MKVVEHRLRGLQDGSPPDKHHTHGETAPMLAAVHREQLSENWEHSTADATKTGTS